MIVPIMDHKFENRRTFLKSCFGLGVLSLLPLGAAHSWAAAPKDAPLPPGEAPVDPTDAIVVALGYKPDVKQLDYAKYPQRKKPDAKNQFCKNCSLYTALNDGWGKCQMMTSGGVVKATGWCGSYSKKA